MENLNQFIGLYPLSKTLRFELKPEPETLNLFEKWLADEVRDENLLYKDKKIAEAYVVLKPIMDKLHECFINISLLSETIGREKRQKSVAEEKLRSTIVKYNCLYKLLSVR